MNANNSIDMLVINPALFSGGFLVVDFNEWVLNRPTPPPAGTSGIWVDTALWVDGNLWMD